MRRLLLLLSLPLLGQGPHFTVRDALQAEWARQPLSWTETQKAALPPADRARLERTLQRIGAPGSPALVPPELEKPTLEVWEDKAKVARTPQERFTALFMLNRLKSPKALTALDGLSATDAATWPKHLHLEASLAAARLNGAEVSPALQSLLDARQKAGKVDPVRAQAARLRLVMAGKEKELLPLVPATPGSVLTLMDAWNRAPWKERVKEHLALWWDVAGIEVPPPPGEKRAPVDLGRIGLGKSFLDVKPTKWAIWSRIWDGIPDDLGEEMGPHSWPAGGPGGPKTIRVHWASKDPLMPLSKDDVRTTYHQYLAAVKDPIYASAILPGLRRSSPSDADVMRERLLQAPDSIARAAALEDLPSAPADLAILTQRTWADSQFEAQQTLIQSYARWKMTPEDQKAQLRPWLQHPDWACRWEAYQALVKLDPATAWPSAPKPTKTDEAILKEATRLAERGKPVRLRITFSGKRRVTLKLDPEVAPINIANLVLLAKKGYFNGRLVPRVVPDFVVQMGSPYDTMDGGPGYTVRCENSLTWYGPGSVGMALSGKDTGGSQFFITTNATPHLTGKYTRMGEVEDLDRALKLLDDLELGAKIESIKVLEP
ncbi:MAG: peptidylprolyl isomerase [Geothrix sp.]|uniref:peptidylprolyl isomerase n=1 Tax=Geothrix sp. TaxID=1962974 RepID=UPI003BB18847